MGCDIHVYMEERVRTSEYPQGIWMSTDKWSLRRGYFSNPEDGRPRMEVSFEDLIYTARNYLLFSILAGVRNHYSITPISAPKGFPEDASEEVKAVYAYDKRDAHSASYFTLEELMAYDWDTVFEREYIVKNELDALTQFGEKVVRMEDSPEGLTAIVETPVRKHVESFLEVIEKMKKNLYINKDFPEYNVEPKDIRMVFWFDN